MFPIDKKYTLPVRDPHTSHGIPPVSVSYYKAYFI